MRINVSLTRSGDIQKAIDALEEYKRQLVDKEKLFCQKLADIGVNAALMTLASKGQGDADRSASFNIAYIVDGQNVEFVLTVTSKPTYTSDGRVFYPHLAWEFGAGNAFNGGMKSPNPHAEELGMNIGSFPGQTHVPDPGWWYYRDENGDAVRSYGTQATMPMHTASVEIMRSIETIAKEVYGGR